MTDFKNFIRFLLNLRIQSPLFLKFIQTSRIYVTILSFKIIKLKNIINSINKYKLNVMQFFSVQLFNITDK